MNVTHVLDTLKFNSVGLIPVIAVDHITGEVLMLAYANREAVTRTLETGLAHYYSRSRKKLWKKGETSGNVQYVMAVRRDCDSDALIYEVIQHGPVCHTGAASCFFEEIKRYDGAAPDYPFLKALQFILEERKRTLPEGSYSTKLFKNAPEMIEAKLREECEEFIKALSHESEENVEWEAADLIFFTIAGLVWRGVRIEKVLRHLWERHVKSKKGGGKSEE